MTTRINPAVQVPEPGIAKFLFGSTFLAPLWTVLRIYLGWHWLEAGWGKLTNPAGVWVGEKAGTAVGGFLSGALQKTTGDHPDVTGWYAWFIQNVALPNKVLFSYLVTYGEILVGIALIIGLFTGVSAFFAGLLNASFLLAGTVSANPWMFIVATWLVLAWRTAGYIGLDYFVLPRLGLFTAPPKPQRTEKAMM